MNTTARRSIAFNDAQVAYREAAEARRIRAYQMKREQKCTYREIGAALGVSRQRAQQMVLQVIKAKARAAHRRLAP